MHSAKFAYVVFAVMLLLALTSSAALAVVHVKWDSPGPTFDGASWQTAYHTVQEGIDATTPLSNDLMWVARGTYVERITLVDGVKLYGGFRGTETDTSQRNCSTNTTVLDGNKAGSVVTVPAGATRLTVIDGFIIRNGSGTLSENGIDRVGGGIYCSNSSPTIANNVIIWNSATLGGAIYEDNGRSYVRHNRITGNNAGCGAIYCNSSRGEVTNNVITSNSGGAIHAVGDCYPHIINNTIAWNGGCAISGDAMELSNNIVAFNSEGVRSRLSSHNNNCVFGNTDGDYFGTLPGPGSADIQVDPLLASDMYGNAHIRLDSPCKNAGTHNTVYLPTTDIDGQPRIVEGTIDIGADEAGATWPAGPYAIVRVSPDGNDANNGLSWASAKKTVQAAIDAASLAGGEVWVSAGTYSENITLHPFAHLYGGFAGTEASRSARNRTLNKTVLDGTSGSVVTVVGISYGKASTIDGFTIRNGTGTLSEGGSERHGGGICCRDSSPTIAYNTITGSRATYGGGIYCSNSGPTIVNNMILGNTATANGGGIWFIGRTMTIASNTIAANSATDGGAIYFQGGAPTVFNNIMAFNSSGMYNTGLSGAPLVETNCVFGNTDYNYSDLVTGTRDTVADPLFASRENGNYHLSPVSPCINAGSNNAPLLPAVDMDGDPRMALGRVDIGADEFIPGQTQAVCQKAYPDGTLISTVGAFVTGSFTNAFYVEADDRSSGIRVEQSGQTMAVGMRADILGTLRTLTSGERYIQAVSAIQSAPPENTGSVDPLILPNCFVGGAGWNYNPSAATGQMGVKSSIHMNNIGMLITTTGRVTYNPTGTYFVIWDGSKVTDASGYKGIRVAIPVGLTKPAVGEYVRVTGISSIFKSGTDYYPLLRVRDQADIVEIQPL